MRAIQKIGITAAAGVVGVGTLTGVALAQADDPTDSSTPSASASGSATPGSAGAEQQRPDHGGRRGGGAMFTDLAASLAERLGMDQTTVTEAIQAAREATRPAEPSGDGTAPSAADRQANRDAFITELASRLGVDESEISQVLDELQQQALADQQARLQSRLDGAVADGTLTQAEADAVRKAADAGVIDYGGGHG